MEERFSGLAPEASGPRTGGTTEGADRGGVRIVERDVAESYLALSYPAGSFMHPDTPALDVLSKILTDGDSSRLQSTLKHREGLATDTDTYLFSPQEEGLFVIMATFKGRDYEVVFPGPSRRSLNASRRAASSSGRSRRPRTS